MIADDSEGNGANTGGGSGDKGRLWVCKTDVRISGHVSIGQAAIRATRKYHFQGVWGWCSPN
jgi:hypothetical protein